MGGAFVTRRPLGKLAASVVSFFVVGAAKATENNVEQATLPDGLADADHNIASMDIGESGWVVPWAMFHDKKRRLWLNGSYTVSSSPGGTVQMRVLHDENGWHVDATRCREHQWGESGFFGTFPPVAVASAAF